MAIAHQFGTSAELDAYLAAFRIPDLLFALMAGGALGSAFIPVFSTVLSRGDESYAWRLASAVIKWVSSSSPQPASWRQRRRRYWWPGSLPRAFHQRSKC